MSDETRRGCGDFNCEIVKPKGMATHGGCRCSEQEVRRELRRVRRELQRLESDPVAQAAVRLAEATDRLQVARRAFVDKSLLAGKMVDATALNLLIDEEVAALAAYRTAKGGK